MVKVLSKKTKKIKYFAYGSNMYTPRLKTRVPSCKFYATGCIIGYVLRFHKKSVDGSAKCNAFYTGIRRDKVYGVIYEINENEKAKLDAAEGLGFGYNEKRNQKIIANKGIVNTFMYEADKEYIDETLLPYEWYKIYVEEGAKNYKLPRIYQERITATRVKIDPDEERKNKNFIAIS